MTLHHPQLALDGDTDVTIRRRFPHPPARVWRALTEPRIHGTARPRRLKPDAMARLWD